SRQETARSQGAVYAAIELSKTSWVVGIACPAGKYRSVWGQITGSTATGLLLTARNCVLADGHSQALHPRPTSPGRDRAARQTHFEAAVCEAIGDDVYCRLPYSRCWRLSVRYLSNCDIGPADPANRGRGSGLPADDDRARVGAFVSLAFKIAVDD